MMTAYDNPLSALRELGYEISDPPNISSLNKALKQANRDNNQTAMRMLTVAIRRLQASTLCGDKIPSLSPT